MMATNNAIGGRKSKYLIEVLQAIEQKKIALVLLLPITLFYIMFRNSLPIKTTNELDFNLTLNGTSLVSFINNYLVFSTKCKIPSIDPFNKEVRSFYQKKEFVPCSTMEHLIYVTKNENNTEAYIHVNRSMIEAYSYNGVICNVSTVDRRPPSGAGSDSGILVQPYRSFDDNLLLPDKPVLVTCNNTVSHAVVYSNTYQPIILQPSLQAKLEKMNVTPKPFSVLILGIDSTSRLEMIRSMPATKKFLDETGWIEMLGYNKVGENTMPNLMPLITGRNVTNAFIECNPYKPGGLDKCNFLWKDYSRSNYVTIYAEGNPSYSSFNYMKEGFERDPTDYYFRRYYLASNSFLHTSYLDNTKYCLGPISEPERLFGIIQEFSLMFKNKSTFSLFWTNYGHNELNAGSRYDLKFKLLFQTFLNEGVLNKTVIVFLSDHGLRFGKYTYLYSGRLESRLPFLYIWLPSEFKQLHQEKYDNLHSNTNKLTTPYDVYMTLQEILALGANYTIQPSRGCPKCLSLFSKLPSERSCQDAEIPPHFCTCNSFEPIEANNQSVKDSASYIIRYITKIFDDHPIAKKCARYKLKYIKSSRLYWISNEESYILIVMETVPNAVFESTIRINFTAKGDKRFQGSINISRLDFYGPHSKCVGDPYLKTLCYCVK